MQRSRTSLMMMIVCLVILPFLRIPLAEGIKCYECIGCETNEGKVRDCSEDRVGDACYQLVRLGLAYRYSSQRRQCFFRDEDDEMDKRGLICSNTYQHLDDDGAHYWELTKLCYCSTDLCNGQLTVDDNGDGSEGAVLTPEEVLGCSGSSVITGFFSPRQIFFGLVAYFLFKGFFQ